MLSKAKSRIDEVHGRLSAVRGALSETSLAAMLDAQPGLEAAAELLIQLQDDLAQSPIEDADEIRKELILLRGELARVASLSANGLEFCRQWGNALQSAAGYLPGGQAAPFGRSNTMVVRG